MAGIYFYVYHLISCYWLIIASPTGPTFHLSVIISPSVAFAKDNFGEITTHVNPTSPPTDNYLNRLDFISVIVICAIVAFCFGICVIVVCRRRKRFSSSHRDNIDGQQMPALERAIQHEPRTVTSLAYTPSDLRLPESPPPTYSIIERQTSFTSYVSQTSSQYEIPPNYDEALSIFDSTNGEPYSHLSQLGSRTNSNQSMIPPAREEGSVQRSIRTQRTKSNRSRSDVGRRTTHRSRLSTRPATVSEDDSSQCSLTTSAISHNFTLTSVGDSAFHSINVTAEVNQEPPRSDDSPERREMTSVESANPLLMNNEPENDADDVESQQNKNNSKQRKLTLV